MYRHPTDHKTLTGIYKQVRSIQKSENTPLKTYWITPWTPLYQGTLPQTRLIHVQTPNRSYNTHRNFQTGQEYPKKRKRPCKSLLDHPLHPPQTSNSSTDLPQTCQIHSRQNPTNWHPGPKIEKIAQGGVHQKRDIVDTKTHASCAARLNKDKQSGFPTT